MVLHCYCRECERIVLRKEIVPVEVLEISLFKFMEQFFYNKRVSISNSREQEYLGDYPQCPHPVFRSCEMIFRFRSLKTTFKFEHQEAY